MNHSNKACVACLLFLSVGSAQERPAPQSNPHMSRLLQPMATIAAVAAPQPMVRMHAERFDGDEDDPAYVSYKVGYRLILDEKWTEAVARLAEMMAKYPTSDYAVDAAYWSAYAQKHIDPPRAWNAYQHFLNEYPRSSYLDDVVADLAELEATGVGSSDSTYGMIHPGEPTPPLTPMPDMPPRMPRALRGVGFDVRQLERMNQQLERVNYRAMRRIRFAPTPFGPIELRHELSGEELDPGTKLKCDALLALGKMKEDHEALTTLKEVALNTKAVLPLRSAALTSLSKFKDADVLPVFFEVAQKDTDGELQEFATSCIVLCGHDKSQTLETLIRLYGSSPAPKNEQRMAILNNIAELGNERAVNFLAEVAVSDHDPAVASTAIDGIGQAGREKNTTVDVLVRIYGQLPSSRSEERESILYTMADIGNDKAVDFLSKVALSNESVESRGSAIYLLGTIGGEKARTVLYRVLKEK